MQNFEQKNVVCACTSVIGFVKVRKYLFLFIAATMAVWNLGTTLLWQSKQVSTR